MCTEEQLLFHVLEMMAWDGHRSLPDPWQGVSLLALCPPGFALLVNLKVQVLDCLPGLFSLNICSIF